MLTMSWRTVWNSGVASAVIGSMAFASLVLGSADGTAAKTPPSQVDLDVRVEAEKVAAARAAMTREDERGADAELLAGLSARAQTAPSVTLARRAAGVCGWLQSDNDYGRAERLARRVIRRLSTMAEDNEADRVERLYWEAWLEGYALDNKARALELLQAAAELAPDDPRILEDSQRWADALAAFGH